MTVSVNDVNEFSISNLADSNSNANFIFGDASVGDPVGITAFASDQDGTDNVTYGLTTNPGNLFAIDPNSGVVSVAGSLDFETANQHSIEVTATSNDGSSSSETFEINVKDAFEKQSVTISDSSNLRSPFILEHSTGKIFVLYMESEGVSGDWDHDIYLQIFDKELNALSGPVWSKRTKAQVRGRPAQST